MFQAAEEDEEYKKFNKPALNKLKLLPKVVETMQKTHLETSILENNFLDGVRRWLEPFSDKSLPPLNIQTEFFQILSNVSIHLILSLNSHQFRCTLTHSHSNHQN